jgi:Icc-related predicted phosphoesterase
MVYLYGTDFHGAIQKYDAILNFAIENDIKLIHLGADLLPKGSNIFEIQKKFVNGFLKEYYQKAKDKGIDILAFWGNDDVYPRKKYFRKYATLLDEVPYSKDGYEFKAYGMVPDYPFGLKSACKWDYPGWKCPEAYISAPVEFTDQGIVKIEDIEGYFLKKGTIEDDLKNIQVTNKTIMAIHCPPRSVGLDICYDGRAVGSKAVYDFIEAKQPLLTLCGHLHESPEVTGIWKSYIGKTLVIQPGQPQDKTAFVVIEIEDEIKAHRITI